MNIGNVFGVTVFFLLYDGVVVVFDVYEAVIVAVAVEFKISCYSSLSFICISSVVVVVVIVAGVVVTLLLSSFSITLSDDRDFPIVIVPPIAEIPSPKFLAIEANNFNRSGFFKPNFSAFNANAACLCNVSDSFIIAGELPIFREFFDEIDDDGLAYNEISLIDECAGRFRIVDNGIFGTPIF